MARVDTGEKLDDVPPLVLGIIVVPSSLRF